MLHGVLECRACRRLLALTRLRAQRVARRVQRINVRRRRGLDFVQRRGEHRALQRLVRLVPRRAGRRARVCGLGIGMAHVVDALRRSELLGVRRVHRHVQAPHRRVRREARVQRERADEAQRITGKVEVQQMARIRQALGERHGAFGRELRVGQKDTLQLGVHRERLAQAQHADHIRAAGVVAHVERLECGVVAQRVGQERQAKGVQLIVAQAQHTQRPVAPQGCGERRHIAAHHVGLEIERQKRAAHWQRREHRPKGGRTAHQLCTEALVRIGKADRRAFEQRTRDGRIAVGGIQLRAAREGRGMLGRLDRSGSVLGDVAQYGGQDLDAVAADAVAAQRQVAQRRLVHGVRDNVERRGTQIALLHTQRLQLVCAASQQRTHRAFRQAVFRHVEVLERALGDEVAQRVPALRADVHVAGEAQRAHARRGQQRIEDRRGAGIGQVAVLEHEALQRHGRAEHVGERLRVRAQVDRGKVERVLAPRPRRRLVERPEDGAARRLFARAAAHAVQTLQLARRPCTAKQAVHTHLILLLDPVARRTFGTGRIRRCNRIGVGEVLDPKVDVPPAAGVGRRWRVCWRCLVRCLRRGAGRAAPPPKDAGEHRHGAGVGHLDRERRQILLREAAVEVVDKLLSEPQRTAAPRRRRSQNAARRGLAGARRGERRRFARAVCAVRRRRRRRTAVRVDTVRLPAAGPHVRAPSMRARVGHARRGGLQA